MKILKGSKNIALIHGLTSKMLGPISLCKRKKVIYRNYERAVLGMSAMRLKITSIF